MTASSSSCVGCGATLSVLQAGFVGDASFNLWAREGYCSFPCFRETAPAALRERHEGIESGRFDRDRKAAGLPRKRHAPRPREKLDFASVFRRLAARVCDAVLPRVIVLVSLGFWLAGPIAANASGSSLSPVGVPPPSLSDVFAILFSDGESILKLVFGLVAGGIVYYTVCDRLGGQTPAKSLARLRVVTEGGRPASLTRCVVRETLAIFDVVFAGVVGFVCMSMSKERQRLGDMIAGTVVVRDTRPLAPNLGRSVVAALAAIAVWVGGMRLLWL